MRVLQLLSSTGYHGAESMAAELIRQLHARDVILDVGIFDNSGRGDRTVLDVAAPYIADAVVIPCRGQLSFEPIVTLRRYIAHRRPDVIHSHKYKTTFYALLARRARRPALVVTYHNWLTTSLPLKFYAALDKQLARYVDAAVGVSRQITRELHRYGNPSNIVHIGNGIDTTRFQQTAPRAVAKQRLNLPDTPLVGFVGRLTPEKGVTSLLHAVQRLPTALRDVVHVVIVGDGDHRGALEAETRLLGMQSRVHFLGTRADMSLIYSALDAFVLPSRQEAFPMVVLEAMACQAPVIATRVGDVAHMLDDGRAGLIVAPDDVTALESALRRVLTDHSLALQITHTAQQRVGTLFSAHAMAQRYLTLYQRLYESRQRAG